MVHFQLLNEGVIWVDTVAFGAHHGISRLEIDPQCRHQVRDDAAGATGDACEAMDENDSPAGDGLADEGDSFG